MGLLQWHDISYAIFFLLFSNPEYVFFPWNCVHVNENKKKATVHLFISEALILLKHIVDMTKKSKPHIREWKHSDC